MSCFRLFSFSFPHSLHDYYYIPSRHLSCVSSRSSSPLCMPAPSNRTFSLRSYPYKALKCTFFCLLTYITCWQKSYATIQCARVRTAAEFKEGCSDMMGYMPLPVLVAYI